ncbi:hypothetical protein CTI12_AA346000 [Artemisia annua]|uniref:Replication factor-A protein 1 N-terminal domain-containing protein n=1 Tax=Artemisia annua TaxID=35608 RepID=A0A2U1MTD6_ARTAN|nr:hypothetical protein CTI12_AA346000 [Artemisia annua]
MEATAVNLTPDAISKLLTGDIDEMNPAKPVVQVIDIKRRGEYRIVLSDGSKFVKVYISDRVNKLVRSKQLGKGSIVELTKFSGFKSAVFGWILDISKIAEMMMEKNKENDMGACFEKLDKIGWGTENSMYDTAVLLFGESADYRRVWLHLKPESCEKWVKNAGNISKIAEMMMEKNKENDMGACFEKLDKIGWGTEDSMYDTAVLLFGESADYRKVWLHLKPESCEKWVKNAGSIITLYSYVFTYAICNTRAVFSKQRAAIVHYLGSFHDQIPIVGPVYHLSSVKITGAYIYT